MIDPVLPRRLFITGTDTNVGKTHVTCLIARQLIANGFRVAAYKPVCSGAVLSVASASPHRSVPSDPNLVHRWDDIVRLKSAIGGDWTDEQICPQRFLAPLAPPLAAKLEGKTIDFAQLITGASEFQDVDCLLIEGAGGWLSPVTETQNVADLARHLNSPILVVGRTGLGTINHTLMTIESIRSRGLSVAGIVLNEPAVLKDDESIRTNADEIEARSGAPVFGVVRHGSNVELHREGKLVTIKWQQLAR